MTTRIRSRDYTWLGCLAVIAFALLFVLIEALLLRWAWNFIMPHFDLPMITLWQAYLLLMLIQVIGGAFKSTTSK